MKTSSAKNLALAAMFIAIGLVLPFFTGQIPQIGNMMLPMHISVLLCGLIQMVMLGVGRDGFTYQAFLAGAFLNAIPGIIIQLIVIPSVMVLLNRTGLVTFGGMKHHKYCHVKSDLDNS